MLQAARQLHDKLTFLFELHQTECSTGGTIASADLLPPEYWQ